LASRTGRIFGIFVRENSNRNFFVHMPKLFQNTQVAFALKSDAELQRAHFLFRLISNNTLVKIGTAATQLALKFHLPVDRLIRATVFDHFCGGVSEQDCLPVVDKMYAKQVYSVLDYSVEGKEDEAHFDDALAMTLKIISFAKTRKALPFAVFKPTGFGRIDLYEKVGAKQALTPAEQAEWNRVEARFDQVCQAAHEANVLVLIDAEESWMQDAADDLVTQMMEKYNTHKAVVFNTLQMYRWDRMDYLKKLHEYAKNKGFHIGMKLVRGAYMEKENLRAQENNYQSPICDSKEATNQNYNAAVQYMLEHLDTMAVFAGTHNEDSSYLVMDLVAEKNIPPTDSRIWFGQLYGMSDNISYNLGAAGYHVAKYLPFGPVREVMPYLIRRAEENTSVAGQTNRELSLIQAERQRRKNAK
jgi:proline dehydrogenase